MLKERRLAAETVAEALFDAAITQTAALAGLMPATRQDANLSAIIGQDALMAAVQTMQALARAREGIVTTHKHLSVAQHDIGLSRIAFGDGGDKPPSPYIDSTGHLTVAA